MASIRPTAKGYRAQICILKTRDSETFRTQREAKAWASVREAAIRAKAGKPVAERHTMADMLTRYRDEVSPTKRGQRWEEIRIKAFLASPILPINSPLSEITPDIIGKWRDSRLNQVSAGTVLREFGLLSAAFEEARREWRWIPTNPITDVRKPRQPDHRDTVLTRPQIKAMLHTLGYLPHRPIRTVSQAVAVAFLLALRTGMRAGELCKLEWKQVHDGYCVLPVTKTKPRDVPLTPKAMRIINRMRGFDPVNVFGMTSQTLSALFMRARDRAGLSGFTFHDSRHSAATWLAQQVHVLDLCRIFGWSNTGRALTYYNPKASDIAKRITTPRHQLPRL